MLYRFSLSNFLSVAEELSLDLFPYGRLRKKKHHVYQHSSVDVLKACAIYGGNGSGKSNLVLAMAVLRHFVVENGISAGTRRVEAFRFDDALMQQASTFEVEFATQGKSYRYRAELRPFTVEAESLHLTHHDDRQDDEELLFSRKQVNGEADVTLNARFKITERDRARISIYVKELLKNSESLLHLLTRNEAYPDLKPAFDWFKEKLVVIHPHTRLANLAEALLVDRPFKKMADGLLQSLDTGVNELSLYGTDYDSLFGHDDPDQKQAVLTELANGAPFVRLNFNGEVVLAQKVRHKLMVRRAATPHLVEGEYRMFFPEDESDGTRRVLDFLPLWHLVFTQDATVIIDEIGRSLHPNLAEQLLRFFLDGDTKGQLVFTTHDTNLLQFDLLRRDEIWLMEKNNKGASTLTPLSDFKIRDDLDLRKSYLNGRFGGVPELRTLFPEDFAVGE